MIKTKIMLKQVTYKIDSLFSYIIGILFSDNLFPTENYFIYDSNSIQ